MDIKKEKIVHLVEHENVDGETGCLCQYVKGQGRKTRLHEHEFYEFFLTLTPVIHYINGRNERLERGSLVFIKPADVHGIIYDYKEVNDIINFSFSRKEMSRLTEYLDISQTMVDNIKNNCIQLTEIETVQLTKKFQKIINHEKESLKYLRIILFELLSRFLSEDEIENTIPVWFEELCAVMKKKENFCEGIEFMVVYSGKSREYISRCMKKYLRMTVTQFLNDIRLSYVASQLISTEKNITDLCLDVGFYSTAWFNKKFAQKYGMTPKEMRKRGR